MKAEEPEKEVLESVTKTETPKVEDKFEEPEVKKDQPKPLPLKLATTTFNFKNSSSSEDEKKAPKPIPKKLNVADLE